MWWGDKHLKSTYLDICSSWTLFRYWPKQRLLSFSSQRHLLLRRTPKHPPGHRYDGDVSRYAGEFVYPARWSWDSVPLLIEWVENHLRADGTPRRRIPNETDVSRKAWVRKAFRQTPHRRPSAFEVTPTVKCPAHRAIRWVYRIFFMEYFKKKGGIKLKDIPGKQKPLWQWLSI